MHVQPRQRARVAAFVIALASLGVVAGCTTPNQEVQTVAAKQAMCAACHGPEGTSVSVRSPVLAGQQQGYIAAQLKAFRDHSRADAGGRTYMWPMAAGLTDPMIERLATYFSTLPLPPPLPQASEAADVADGKAIYEKSPCSSCHGDKGQGMAAFPRLAGQHADYLSAQLAAYADGSRANPIMGPMAKSLSAKQAQSIAAWLAAQR
jgi:cytochrome c553